MDRSGMLPRPLDGFPSVAASEHPIPAPLQALQHEAADAFFIFGQQNRLRSPRHGDCGDDSGIHALHLGIRAASVTGMLQKLAAQKPSFVKYEKHRGVRLTASGKMRAL